VLSSRRELKIKSLSDIPDWKIIEFYERGLISGYFKKMRDEDFRGIITAADGSVPAMVNEKHHLVLQDLRPGFQLERAWSEVDALDDLFSSELQFAWNKKFGYLGPDSECCGTGLDVVVNVHLPGLILLDEMAQAVSAFGAVGLSMDTEISDDLLVSGFGQMLRISNNMTVPDSEDTVLSKMEQAVGDLVLQEEQARLRVLKSESLKRLMCNKISCSLAVLKNSLIMSRPDTFEYLSWLRTGAALGFVKGLTCDQVDQLHRDVWASNFLSYFRGPFEEAVEHVDVTRAAVLGERLAKVELALD
jgi:protein arginine kinase